MRRALVVLALVLTAPAPAAAAITLDAQPTTPRYQRNVTFSGTTSPGEQVRLYVNGNQYPGATVTAGENGNFAFVLPATHPGSYDARTSSETSAPVALKIRPLLTHHRAGLPYPGNRFVLKGRLRPASAGSLTLKVGTRSWHVRLRARGHYTAVLPTDRLGRHRARLVINPHTGYKGFTSRMRYRVRSPYLSMGSSGKSVLALERRLAALRHVLRSVNRYYSDDTYEAVLAFQKVHRMTRTGRVSRAVWAALGRARVPHARVASGDHVEVSKTRQVLYEVRHGKVARIVHVSTGATGNTPVGEWHIYSKVPGLNGSGMYYSNFFIGAFAIHGYHSVPAYPASHGCVRTPMWFAPGFYSRWGIGATVYIFA